MTEPQTQIRILLADDHAVVRAGIRQFLERAADLEVIAEAGNGREACELIASRLPDVAVVDVQMPERNGIEVTRWARANYPRVGILILTAYDDDPFITAALKSGANGYVLKTAPPDAIVQAVRDVADGKSVLDPSVTKKLFQQYSSASPSAPVEELTAREIEVLTLTGRGFTNKAIGHQLAISDRTVQNHLARIFEKLQAASRTEAVMRAVALGWLPSNLGKMADE